MAVDCAVDEIIHTGSAQHGNFTDTCASDNVYEELHEANVVNPGNAFHPLNALDVVYAFNVTGGDVVTFCVKAYETGAPEDYVFAFSTDGATFIDMLTVNRTADDGSEQCFELPPHFSGRLYVRVKDTPDANDNQYHPGSLFIDAMHVTSGVLCPTPSPTPCDTITVLADLYAVNEHTYLGEREHGSFTDTFAAEKNYETLAETFWVDLHDPSVRFNTLLHVWTFDLANAPGNARWFCLKAHRQSLHDNENFAFAYSTDGVNYTYLLQVNNPTNDDAAQWVRMPDDISGTVSIRATDLSHADSFDSQISRDHLYIDQMFIECSDACPVVTLGAELVLHSLPARLNLGQTILVGVKMRNTGGIAWPADQGYALNVLEAAPKTVSGDALPMNGGDAVGPNQTTTFYVSVTAPSQPGMCMLALRMGTGQGAYFGGTALLGFMAAAPPNAVGNWAEYE